MSVGGGNDMSFKVIYLLGSLRNPRIPGIANQLRQELPSLEFFNDWHCAGPEADDLLRDHYRERGFAYDMILLSHAARNTFEFDRRHLDRCDGGILIYPAGRSAHLELGYLSGQGKPTFVLMDAEPERVDIMLQFASGGVFLDLPRLITELKKRESNG